MGNLLEDGDVEAGVGGGEGVVGEDAGVHGDAAAAFLLEGDEEGVELGGGGEGGGGDEGGVDGAEEIDGGFLNKEVGGDGAVAQEEEEGGVAGKDGEGGDGAAEGG